MHPLEPSMHQAATAMYRFPLLATPPSQSRGSEGTIDAALWRKIDAATGGTTRFSRALLIEANGPQPRIMVVVVERHGLPGDPHLRDRFGLTPREREVALLMADRLSNREIADRLGITVHTVRRHCEVVLRKLAVPTRGRVRAALEDSQLPAVDSLSKSAA